MEIGKKIFTYRGKNLEELRSLDVREFAKLLSSRQRRSVLREFQKVEDFVSRAQKKIEKNKPVKTHLRDIVIVPAMVGMRIQVHCGKGFTPVDIIEEMLGHKLGEFAMTRGKVNHGSAGVGATKSSKSIKK